MSWPGARQVWRHGGCSGCVRGVLCKPGRRRSQTVKSKTKAHQVIELDSLKGWRKEKEHCVPEAPSI